MATLEELKNNWLNTKDKTVQGTPDINSDEMKKIIKSRIRKEVNIAMRYFWATLTYHIIVYSMLSHVIVKYFNNPFVLSFAMFGIVLFVPFTVVLMRKYKRLALEKISTPTTGAIYENIKKRIDLLSQFLRFKRRYELILLPLSCFIGVVIAFEIFFPGQWAQHVGEMAVLYCISLISCIAAVYRENRLSFMKPIHELNSLRLEFDQNSNDFVVDADHPGK